MKALVHIGMPKTGSSAIQSWLEINSKALEANGVSFSRIKYSNRIYDGAHVELAICIHNEVGELMPNKAVRAFYKIHSMEDQQAFAAKYSQVFASAIAGMTGDICVLSSEYLGAGCSTPDHIAALESWMSRYFESSSYVVYFRRQEDIAASSYSQRLKRGAAAKLDDIVRIASRMDYYETASNWVDSVGRDRFDVRVLEPDALVGGDLISDFASQLGVDPAAFEPPKFSNTSLSHPAVELLRAFNARTPAFLKNGSRNPVSRDFMRRLTAEDARRDYPGLRLTQRQINTIRKGCQDSNERLRSAFLPDRPELFAERPRTRSKSSRQIKLAAMVADLAATIYVKGVPRAAAPEPSETASDAGPARQNGDTTAQEPKATPQTPAPEQPGKAPARNESRPTGRPRKGISRLLNRIGLKS